MLIKAKSEVNMSDLNQVYLIANEFAKWWAENPELRFGQDGRTGVQKSQCFD